eukprot:240865_1
MDMFSWWKCSHCDLYNHDDKIHCMACFRTSKQLSPVKSIMYEQELLFHGYLRLNHLMDGDVPLDIVNLCFKYHVIDIASFDEKHTLQRRTLCRIAVDCRMNDDFYMAHNILRILIESDEDVCYYHYAIANVLHGWNVLDSAEDEYKRAIELKPSDASYKYRYALLLQSQEEYTRALAVFERAMKLDELNAEYHFEIAYCHEKLNDFDASKTCYLRAIELEPENAKYKYWYGLLLEDKEQYHDALVQFNAACALVDDEAEYVFEVAYCCGKLKQYCHATMHYLKTIAMEPTCAKYCNFYAQYLCKELGNLDECKTYFERAMAIEPSSCSPYYQYAKVLRDYVSDYAESEKYYLKTLAIDGRNYGSNGSYAYLLYLMRDYDKAMKHVKIELEISQKNKWAHYYHGLLQKTLGNELKANESLLKAVECTQKTSHIVTHLQRIKASDPINIDYHNEFEKLLNQKTTSNAVDSLP